MAVTAVSRVKLPARIASTRKKSPRVPFSRQGRRPRQGGARTTSPSRDAFLTLSDPSAQLSSPGRSVRATSSFRVIVADWQEKKSIATANSGSLRFPVRCFALSERSIMLSGRFWNFVPRDKIIGQKTASRSESPPKSVRCACGLMKFLDSSTAVRPTAIDVDYGRTCLAILSIECTRQ